MSVKRILFIEADPDYQDMVKTVLENAGYLVDTQSLGDDGYKMARKYDYDLIILNVELPDVNGYALCKRLRTEEKTKNVPLIMTSERATREDFDKHRKLKVRADDYLHKPYTDDQILKKVENLIGFKISEEEFMKLQESFEQLLQEKTELEKMIRDYEDLRTSLEAKIEELSAQVRDLEAALEEKDQEILKLKKDADTSTDKFERIKEVLGEVASRIQELMDELD